MIKDMIEATDFRDAMALLPTAVNVITTNGPSGTHGFTASAVCSVTDTPPKSLVCRLVTTKRLPPAPGRALCVSIRPSSPSNTSACKKKPKPVVFTVNSGIPTEMHEEVQHGN